MGTGLEVAVVVALILANGVFSMSETAVVSSRRARLQQRAEAGDAGARRALGLAENPNVFLATVQVGITLIGVVSGAFGGARLSGPVASALRHFPGLGSAADPIAFGLVVLVITYLSLVVGELVPKRVALNAPESVAAAVAGPMARLARGVSPVVRLLGSSTDAALRLLRVRASTDPPVTEEEVGVLLEQGARAGVFHPAERDMVERVFGLADARVVELMVPRPDVAWLDTEASPEEVLATLEARPFARYPVCRGDLDYVVGLARATDLLLAARSGPIDLEAAAQPPLLVPESATALELLERFRRFGGHLALVVDEYGGTAGLVTVGDVLEAIVGDLGAGDGAAPDGALRRGDASWLLDGGLTVGGVREVLGLDELPGEDGGGYVTLAGFVLDRLARIPAAGDAFAWGGWRFEVIDMDGTRVDKVLARPEEQPTPPA